MKNKICSDIEVVGQYVAQWIKKQPSVKEESLTDWLLYDLSVRNSKVLYHAFTRHAESFESGADWEWWFFFDKYRLRFRVQAKRATSKQKDIWGELVKSNKRGLQIEMLLASSKKNNAYPLYAFFTDLSAQTMCEGQKNGVSAGIYAASAERLHAQYLNGVIKRPVKPTDLLVLSTPFHCFACCDLIDINGNMSKFLEYYFQDTDDKRDKPIGYYSLEQELPEYVARLLESAGRTKEDRKDSPQKEPSNLQGIALFDFRTEN